MATVYTFAALLFEENVEAPWVFLALPEDIADEIAATVPRTPGFGSVRVEASIGASEWRTSLFPSKARGTYILPVKRRIREREGIATGDMAEVTLRLVPD